MSQMCPSSSHQLVAAAFRRARRKFPKNFGQLSWPVNYERKDSKLERLSSMKTCKKCEERFACQQEIRNVKSNDVWPQFTASWSTDPRSTRSMRENSTLHRRRKGETTTTTNCGGCACRRICRATRRNVVVSFSEDGKSNKRCSGGDGAAGRSSIETISCRSCQIQGKPSECCFIEKREDIEDARKKRDERKSKTMKHRSYLPRNSMKNHNLDLLYDRSCRTKNSVSFLFKENYDNSSLEEEDGSPRFSSKLHECENRAREDSIEPATGPERVNVGEEAIANCDCAGKYGGIRNESYRSRRHQHRHNSHSIRQERESVPQDELLPKPVTSRASSSKESNRLCKDCALGQCPRNSATAVAFLREEHDAEEEEDRSGRVDDACAIKHKDSMALLVEKFKNKKTTNRSDDETIFKFDEDTSSRTKMNEKTIVERTGDKANYVEYDEYQNEDLNCCKIHSNSAHSQTNKFHNRTNPKNLKFRQIRSGCCCSSKETSCRHVL